jgi:hypothetical protein
MAMIPRVAKFYDRLAEQKAQFLGTLEGFSAEQLSFRIKPDAWNVVQVGHHVVLAEQGTADSIKQHRGIRSGKRRLHHRLGYLLLWGVLKTGLRVKNPVPAAAPDADIDLGRLEQLWDKARGDLGEVLSEVKERGLQYAAFKHPVGGPFTVEDSLEFLVAHLDHHLRQIERIRRNPSFPP